jgi:23S rRNA (cytosine1962-C5)-methyltransferase
MQSSGFEKALETAWYRREALRGRTTAYRLLNGAASGTPGLIVDAFAGCLVAYAYGKDTVERYGDFASRLAKVTGAESIALKDRSAKGEQGRDAGRDLFGIVPESVDVREGLLKFRVHPRHPRNVGLFLDTRLLREALAESCRAHDVLNLFSYSCSLGVAAAHANQGAVVNVDVSARYLGWGRDNLSLNGLPPDKTKFVRMDSGKYLDWAAKKSLSYDVIILDPPSFSRSEAGTFAFADDYWRLLEKCARLLRPRGRIYALTNFGGITPEQFRLALDETIRLSGRGRAEIRRLKLPEDFDGAGAAESGAGEARSARPAVEGTLLAYESVLG